MRARRLFTFFHTHSRLIQNAKFAAAAGLVAYTGYNVIKSQFKQKVIDTSVLRSYGDDAELNVLDALRLHSASNGYTTGRTCGHRVYVQNHEENRLDYYFYKETYDRDDLIKELFYGALGRHLAGDIFPDVFLVETPLNDASDHSRYAFLSENVGDDEENNDLEKWAKLYHSPDSDNYVTPSYLGVALAYSMLMGQSDCKLANLAVISDAEYAREGSCYPIDFESCENLPPLFLTKASDAIEFIGEFRAKSLAELTMEINADGLLDTQDDAHKPLRDKSDVKDAIYPVLLHAVQKDIDEESVIQLYRGFACMNDESIHAIFDKFGCFIRESERKHLLNNVHMRQQATREFLEVYDLSTQETRQSAIRKLT